MRTTFNVLATITCSSVVALVLAAEHPAASVSADAALAKLKEGNLRFASSEVSQSKPTAARRAETAQEQHPFAIILGCADSRTAPGHIESLVRDIQLAVKAAKGKPGDALSATVTENARQVAAQIKAKAALGDLAKEVRIVSAVYDLDTGKIGWAND